MINDCQWKAGHFHINYDTKSYLDPCFNLLFWYTASKRKEEVVFPYCQLKVEVQASYLAFVDTRGGGEGQHHCWTGMEVQALLVVSTSTLGHVWAGVSPCCLRGMKTQALYLGFSDIILTFSYLLVSVVTVQ